jgi:ABC-type branched-subunit amino acid transport system ATPase component/sugar phosphate permease
MSLTVEPAAPPGVDGGPPLAPTRTPRPSFQMTRRLVGASRWPLILLSAIYAINVTDQYVLPSLFPLFKQEFGMSDSALGFLSGSYVIVVTVFTIPFGYLADRKRRTRVISWGTAAWGLCMIWTGAAWSYLSLLAARMTLGAWDPSNKPTSQSLLADYYPTVQRSKVMSVYQSGQLLGILFVPVSAAMATRWGWRSAFFFFSIPAFVAAILARRLPEPVRGQQDRLQQDLNPVIARKSIYDTMSSRDAYRALFRVRAFTLTTISSGVGSLFFGSIGTWSPTFFVRYHDMTISQAASSLSLLALGGLVGVLISGWAADYLTYRGLKAGRLLVGAFARLAAVPLFILTFAVANTPVMLLSFTLASMCLVAPQGPMNAARADVLHPSLRGRGTAVDVVVQSISAAIAPVMVGLLADQYGLRTAFLICVPLMGLSGLIVLLAVPAYVTDERRLRVLVRREALGDDGGSGDGDDDGGADGPGDDRPPGGDGRTDGTAGDEAPEADGAVARGLVQARAGPARPDDGAILVVDDLDLSYGTIQVLFGVSFRVPESGVHALVGRNGVGKTTLLAAIAGLVDGHHGRITFEGVDLTGVPPDQRVKLGITLMAGGRSTFPSLTVQENLWIGAYPFHRSDELVRQRMDALLDVFPPLRPRLRQSGGTLSGGEQQMVALGRALMAGPRLLLVDELSLGLAPVVIEHLLPVIRSIRELGTTVLMVEQAVPVALEVADTVMFMEKGEVTCLGDAAALGDGEQLVRMMMGSTV